jgi:hypothetical protein
VIDRVSKLLALSGNNPSAHEAQEALTKARDLMARYNIMIGEISENGVDDIKETSTALYSRAPWKRKIAFIVARRFRCKLYYRANHSAQKMCFLGHDLDAATALKSYEFTIEYADTASNRYTRAIGGAKGDWMYGFLMGLEEVFKEQDAIWTSDGEQALVLVSQVPDDVVQQFNKMFEGAKPSRFSANILKNGDERTVLAGYRTGKDYGSGNMLDGGDDGGIS